LSRASLETKFFKRFFSREISLFLLVKIEIS
jgi:hypothetical protein